MKGKIKVILISILLMLFFLSMSSYALQQYSLENPMGKRPTQWSDKKVDCSELAKDPPWTIGVSNYSLANTWRVQVFAELQYAADQDPRIKELIITNADGNLAKQIADIEDLMARKVDAMLITPLSADGIAPLVEEIYSLDIPVVIFNNEISTDKFHSIIWIDEFKRGYLGGKWLNDKLGGKGNVVMLEGIAGTSTSDLMTQGAEAAFEEGINVLAKQPASWAYDQAKSVTEDFIAAFPKIDGIYSQGGAMSLAAMHALQAAGMDLLPVNGEGYNGFLKFWFNNRDKGFSSIAVEEICWQSVVALEQVIKCLEGKVVDQWFEAPIPLITDENLEEFVRLDCPDIVWACTKLSKEKISEMYNCGSK